VTLVRFLADQNFDHDILSGVLRHEPTLDIVTALGVGLDRTPDPEILAWAASAGRVLLTHDVNTVPTHATERIREGLAMAGVCIVPRSLPIGRAIEDLLLVAVCITADEWRDQIRYLPV
jgi:hypothetical protein